MSRATRTPKPQAGAGRWTRVRAAEARPVADARPGIRRVRAATGFRYVGPDGAPVRDAATLSRIRGLRIPPAWSQVWISASPRSHIQATGRDSRGRKQYRYHRRWEEARGAAKYARTLAFGEALPALRERVDRDLARPGLPRDKVLALVVRLLDTTLIRVGNREYVRQNRSFGLTTLRNRHVRVVGSRLEFRFRGKGGKQHTLELADPRLARLVQRCQEVPGYQLFQYLDGDGKRHSVQADDVNEYLRSIVGDQFTAKDFRTWAGTVLAASLLRASPIPVSETAARRQEKRAIDAVACRLGNTTAVCRRCYVHPVVLERYRDGSLAAMANARGSGTVPAGLGAEEAVALAVLRQRSSSRGRGGHPAVSA